MDSFEFILALDLHKDVEEILAMPNWQIVRWRAFYVYRRAMEDQEMRNASRGG